MLWMDTTERNERLIALTERQQATLHAFESPGQEGNLREIEDRLAEMRAVQESTLQALANEERTLDYEAVAAQAAWSGTSSTDPFADFDATPTTLARDGAL